jgi:glycerol-3-phosphate O-acyltransferase
LFRQLYDSIVINDVELKQLKQMITKTNQTVMLLPTFKSIIDFVLLSYVHVMYDIELPFVCGLKEFD